MAHDLTEFEATKAVADNAFVDFVLGLFFSHYICHLIKTYTNKIHLSSGIHTLLQFLLQKPCLVLSDTFYVSAFLECGAVAFQAFLCVPDVVEPGRVAA